jgi:glycosyltransferase involved in cell wall biosynthesis
VNWRGTIAVIEPASAGHHGGYLRAFVESFLARGHRVLALSPLSRELSRLSSDDRLRCFHFAQPAPIPLRLGPARPALAALRHWHEAVHALQRATARADWHPDLLFFPSIDRFTDKLLSGRVVRRLTPLPFTGLLLHAAELRFEELRSRLGPNHRTLRHAAGVLTLDEGIAPRLETELGVPVRVLPDIVVGDVARVDDRRVDEIRARAAGRPIVCVVGALDRRKGLLDVLRLARASAGEDWFFVVAGPVRWETFDVAERDEVARRLASPPDNAWFDAGRVLSDPELHATMAAADVVWTAYRDFGSSSNVLTHAAHRRKPVVASAGALLEERVQRFGLGAVVQGRAHAQLRAALDDARAAAATADFDGYLAVHARPRFDDALDGLLEAIAPSR